MFEMILYQNIHAVGSIFKGLSDHVTCQMFYLGQLLWYENYYVRGVFIMIRPLINWHLFP